MILVNNGALIVNAIFKTLDKAMSSPDPDLALKLHVSVILRLRMSEHPLQLSTRSACCAQAATIDESHQRWHCFPLLEVVVTWPTALQAPPQLQAVSILMLLYYLLKYLDLPTYF